MRKIAGAAGSVVVVTTVFFACSGGGGTVSGGGSGGTPAQRCESFLALHKDCSARAGRPSGAVADCQGATLDKRTLVQIDCAIENANGYCKTILAVFGDGGRIDPNDPDIRALNACYSRRSLVSPCKEAFEIVSACGGQLGFAPECSGSSATLASCITKNPTGACQLYGARDASSPSNTPEIQALSNCIQQAARPDGG